MNIKSLAVVLTYFFTALQNENMSHGYEGKEISNKFDLDQKGDPTNNDTALVGSLKKRDIRRENTNKLTTFGSNLYLSDPYDVEKEFKELESLFPSLKVDTPAFREMNSLMMAAEGNCIGNMEKLLGLGADVNARGEGEYAKYDALTVAIKENNYEAVAFLLKQPNILINRTDLNPLCIAIRNNNQRIARILLAKGADPEIKEEETGKNAFEVAKEKNYGWLRLMC